MFFCACIVLALLLNIVVCLCPKMNLHWNEISDKQDVICWKWANECKLENTSAHVELTPNKTSERVRLDGFSWNIKPHQFSADGKYIQMNCASSVHFVDECAVPRHYELHYDVSYKNHLKDIPYEVWDKSVLVSSQWFTLYLSEEMFSHLASLAWNMWVNCVCLCVCIILLHSLDSHNRAD